jgi:MFS superfamily sulfate permease-like transporter
LGWRSIAPNRLARVPASLVAVGAATLAAAIFALPAARVTVPQNPMALIQLLDLKVLSRLLEWPILQYALTMAFLASIESLLSASAVDRLHAGPRTNYDKELAAQGLGNTLCGLLGGIPLSGVIIRSATNVAAGARTRLAGVLHGFWLLVLVAAVPEMLTLVPTASLSAILLVAVFKLVNVPELRALWRQDKREVMIAAVTAATTVGMGVLPGVLLGVGMAIAKLLYTIGRLQIHRQDDPENRWTVLRLQGTATFLGLPKLARALDEIPPETELHVRFEQLSLIDHACLELLINWERQHQNGGGSLVIDWQGLQGKFVQSQAGPPQTSSGPMCAASPSRRPRRSRFLRSGWQKVLEAVE